MKRFLYFLPVIFLAVFFVGCKGDRGPMGPAGPAGVDGADGEVTYFKVINYTIKPEDWVEQDGYLSYTETFKEITEDVFEYGATMVYIVTDNNTYSQLPRVLHHTETDENGDPVFWTTTFDAEVSPYQISFYVTNSDFKIDNLTELNFRIVCIL